MREPRIGATLNQTGALIIEAERVGAESLLSQIVVLVAQAQRTRAPLQRLADTVSAWFVPAVILIAALTFVVWWLVGPEPRLTYSLVNAVAVLIMPCPCALGLATPISIMVASGRGAQIGVLFRDARAIEALREIDTLVVDKTGTLTEDKPALDRVVTIAPWSETEVLSLAAGLERASEHPLARAERADCERDIERRLDPFAKHHPARDRREIGDEAIDLLRSAPMRLLVIGVAAEKLVAPDRHVARTVRGQLRVPVDDPEHLQLGKLPTTACLDPRQIRDVDRKHWGDGSRATRVGPVAGGTGLLVDVLARSRLTSTARATRTRWEVAHDMSTTAQSISIAEPASPALTRISREQVGRRATRTPPISPARNRS